MGLIYSIASIGIPAYGMYRIAQLKTLGLDTKPTYLKLTGWHLGLSLAVYGLFYLLVSHRTGWNFIHSLLPIGLIYLFANSAAAEWYFQGLERFDIPAIRNVILRSIGLIAMLMLIEIPADYETYYWIITISICCTTLFNTGWIAAQLKKPTKRDITPAIRWPELFAFYIGTVFIGCTDFLDVTLLGLLGNEEQTGLYGNATKLVRFSLVIPMAFNLVVSPRFSSHQAKGDTALAQDLLTKSIEWIIFLAAPICMLYFLYAKELVLIFSGPAFSGSIEAIRWMAGIPLFIPLSNLLIYYGLTATSSKHNQTIAIGVIVGILLSVGLNYWLIPKFGSTGAAMNSLVIEFSFMIFFMLLLKPTLQWGRHVLTTLTCLTFIPIWMLLEGTALLDLVKILIGGTVSCLLYLIIQHRVWKHSFLSDIRNSR